jgi:hypothetical protein
MKTRVVAICQFWVLVCVMRVGKMVSSDDYISIALDISFGYRKQSM